MNKLRKFVDGRTDLIFELVESGHDPHGQDEHGTPLIRWCAYYGDVSAIKFLQSKGASLTELGENFDLNGAAFHGHWQLCQFLLENGADANSVLVENGESVLHSALSHPNRPASNLIVKLLLANGANPNVLTVPGQESGAFMRDARTAGESPLHRAAAFGNEETIQMLLDAGADTALTDHHGDSPLSWASWHCRPASILKLLAFGEHSIHPLHVRNMQSDHGTGWGAGMSIMRMGTVHLSK